MSEAHQTRQKLLQDDAGKCCDHLRQGKERAHNLESDHLAAVRLSAAPSPWVSLPRRGGLQDRTRKDSEAPVNAGAYSNGEG